MTMAGTSAFKAYLSLVPKLDESAESTIKRDLSNVDTTDAGKSMGTKLAKGLKAAAVAGVTAAGTAIVAALKQSLDAFAEYEQLEGGIKKLFGEDGHDFLALEK